MTNPDPETNEEIHITVSEDPDVHIVALKPTAVVDAWNHSITCTENNYIQISAQVQSILKIIGKVPTSLLHILTKEMRQFEPQR